MLKDKITIVVLCYNEYEVLLIFMNQIDNITRQMPNQDFEIILIDDGSKDATLERMKEMAKKDSRVCYLSFSRNFGKEAAIYAGLSHAKGDFVVIMDADLQDPPELLPEMYQAVKEEGYDSVATRRVTRKGEPPIRSFFARLFYKILNKMTNVEIVDGARDFRFMNRKYVNALLELKEYNRFSKGLFGWIGFKTKWLEYENVERAAGETKWSFFSLFKYSIEGIVAFTTAPLMLSAGIGFFVCLIAALAVIFISLRKVLFGDPVDGWASLMCVVTFLGGIQLFYLGILGSYLSKMYLEIKNRPVYIVAEDNIKE